MRRSRARLPTGTGLPASSRSRWRVSRRNGPNDTARSAGYTAWLDTVTAKVSYALQR